ncbi:ATPase component of ABC transporter with duplicated ATPase domain [Pediococcus damnosus]|uniref:ribosomal protection-like ABC-F family protein n=1 Tax=Pediococcus damnosus TaxID=51663 RepID=UPI00078E3B60|nr:ABC-F type ribosomal protection protein [Pediococcus damnosus]AMV69861.1 ATPase component of ABC transporter with duplicated ATPase domain [Pediococcus damnosus]
MSKIEIKNLTFGYETQGNLLFDHVNLNLDSNWKLGLIGRNGRGKTTFLNLLQNKLAYQGTIIANLAFDYFPQTITNPNQLTFYVLNDLGVDEQWKVERELNLLGTNPDILWRKFTSLSGGEQTKVLLASLFTQGFNFSLIDEPTNHLDIKARDQVAAYLKQKKQGFIVISHDRNFVNQVADHTLSIEKSNILMYQGNFATYEEQKKLSDIHEKMENAKLKKSITRLKQTAAEKAEWSRSKEGDKYGNPHKKGSGAVYDTGAIGARAARTMKRSLTLKRHMENDIHEKEKLLKNIEYIDPLTMNFQPSYHDRLLTVKKLTLQYQDTSQPLFEPISFDLKKGNCVGIVGPNGAGKSTLVRAILGDFTGKINGEIVQPQHLTISYVRQSYDDNRGTLQQFAEQQHLNYQEFLNNLHKLGLERNVFTTKIEHMSMGQQKKVELAKSLSIPAELYLWDEPLNYLDIFNQEQLETLITSVKPSMLIIEHDREFIKHVTTDVVELKTIK